MAKHSECVPLQTDSAKLSRFGGICIAGLGLVGDVVDSLGLLVEKVTESPMHGTLIEMSEVSAVALIGITAAIKGAPSLDSFLTRHSKQ